MEDSTLPTTTVNLSVLSSVNLSVFAALESRKAEPYQVMAGQPDYKCAFSSLTETEG